MDKIWITLAIAGLLTFLIRLSFFLLLERWTPPAIFRRGLRFVPTAVLSAFIFPELLSSKGSLYLTLVNPRLLAGLVAALVAWRTRNAAVTVFVGLIMLWVLQYYGS
jgi:branched-subunit amino acid transport protein